ncbi:ABC transporter substrate-binding protein [Flavimobilis marinus]|uniref:Iron complex transport system substrate-binding protein n=1 Tax=Flavimobilis marinus TaxID=285351 RepID=A0A1I2E1T0_9MICO|nr:putative F420-0 ABC transporter substrate-binding protein [Flavimobilis marinus]GHG43824.1 ABC transporter substrate-binding protein [Flavimobilis marinus]SFE86573.1 iron complex transport system substrate-binding protein [Flavimobilis marinus]
MPLTSRRRTAPALLRTSAVVALVALGTAACSGTESRTPEVTSEPVETAGLALGSSTYPLTLDNCGTLVTFEAAPQRVVTIKSATTEMLLALGAGDTIVATAYPDGPAPEPYTAEAAAIPVISDRVPGQEAVLEQEPDLVYAGWESNFAADGAGERAALEALDVRTFVAPSACKGDGYRPAPLTFDDVFGEIVIVGQVFDRAEEAAALVTEQQAALEEIVPDDRGLTALWFSSGSDTPYVGGGTGAPALLMDTAGLTNIAAEIDDSWGPFGWEQVAAADPDVIVLVDSPWNSAEKKIKVLEEGPLTSKLTAVQEQAYVVIDFPATEAGVRTVDAAAQLARDVATLGQD